MVERRASRSSAVDPAPNSCSKATRGSRITGRGFRGRGPAQRVGVHAGVAVRAAPGLVDVLDAQLHRGDRRVLTEAVRVDLVQRSAHVDIRSLGLLDVRLRQERRRGAEVVPADLLGDEGFGHLHVGVAHDGEVPAPRLQGAQGGGREVEVAADRGGAPEVLLCAPRGAARRPVRHLHRDQARGIHGPDGLPSTQTRRNHGVEHGQGHGGAHALQEDAARNVLAGDQSHRFLPRSCDSCFAGRRRSDSLLLYPSHATPGWTIRRPSPRAATSGYLLDASSTTTSGTWL